MGEYMTLNREGLIYIFIFLGASLLVSGLVYLGIVPIGAGLQPQQAYCGQDEKYYALELGYYISANVTDTGLVNRTIPVLKQWNCLTYRGLNQSTGIYAVTNEDLLYIFQNISLDRCKGATATFQNDISCRIWNGTDWTESIFPYSR